MKLHTLHIGNVYLTAPPSQDFADFIIGEPLVSAPDIDPAQLEADRQMVLQGLRQTIIAAHQETETPRD